MSLCLLTAMLLTKTSPEPTALTMPEQWATSASPILVTAGIFNSPYGCFLFELTVEVCYSIDQFLRVGSQYAARLVFQVQILLRGQNCQEYPRTLYKLQVLRRP
jgi:hypothetical protein